MRKALSLILALTLCLALAVPALAVESTNTNLTPEAAERTYGFVLKSSEDMEAARGAHEHCGACAHETA